MVRWLASVIASCSFLENRSSNQRNTQQRTSLVPEQNTCHDIVAKLGMLEYTRYLLTASFWDQAVSGNKSFHSKSYIVDV